MKKHSEYLSEKTMDAYEKYLRGEYFVKTRAVILKDGQVAFLKHKDNGYLTIPGGGVENNESLEDATIRESIEETGIKVKPLVIVGKNYYDIPMQIGDVDFTSKRVEYFYLCEYLGKEEGHNGVEGEYSGEVEIYFDDILMLYRWYYVISNDI